jgi:hypothetical protein
MMAILRKKHKRQYSNINQDIFKDERLSMKEIGLLTKMLSLPDNWDFSELGLCKIFKQDGRDGIRSGLKRLQELGYLYRQQIRDEKGKFLDWEWFIYETITDNNHFSPMLENPTSVKPKSENPRSANPTQYNTNVSTTKQSITKESISAEIFFENSDEQKNKETKDSERKRQNRELHEWFMKNIWERYPQQHRVGEKVCFSKFKSAIRNGSSKEEIIEGFNTYLKVIELNKNRGSEQYIKRLDNWFAAESWKNPNKYMKSQMDYYIEKGMRNSQRGNFRGEKSDVDRQVDKYWQTQEERKRKALNVLEQLKNMK